MASALSASALRALVVAAASVIMLAGVLTAPAALAAELGTGSVSGHVTGPDGRPVANASVNVAAAAVPGHDGQWWYATTDASGAYTVPDLSPGTYKLRVDAGPGVDLAPQWWQGAATEDAASLVTVVEGADTDVSPVLTAGSRIAGVVRDDTGGIAAGASVSLLQYDTTKGWWVWRATQPAATDGSFAFLQLPEGTYTLNFSSGAEQEIVSEYWRDASDPMVATLIVLSAGEHVDGLDPRVARAGSISGTVVDDAGQPLARAQATAHVKNVPGVHAEMSMSSQTDQDGAFRIGGLREGEYTLEFGAGQISTNVVGEWWDGSTAEDAATPLTVSADTPVSGLRAVLSPGGAISGTVHGLSGAVLPNSWISVHQGGRFVVSTQVRADGTFDVAHLRAGDYTLEFFASPVGGGSLSEWWQDAKTAAAATPVSVTTGQTTSGIDVVLDESDGSNYETYTAGLSGTVTDQNGAPIAGAEVGVSAADMMSGDGAVTDAQGNWSLEGLPAGQFIVSFTATINGESVTRFWKDAADAASATVIELARGEHKADVSSVLRSSALPPVASSVPTIRGTAQVGTSLTALAGAWTPGATLAYQWSADGQPIAGATASTLSPTPAEVGKRISVTVTGTKDGYTPATTTSDLSPAVALGALTSSVPTISGTAAVGSTLTATSGTWTPGASLSYQWYADATAISGATASTFALTAAHAGKQMSVTVTGSLPGYTAAAKTSAKTPKVLLTAVPTVGGTASVGSTLTATTGSWTAGTSFSYQWYADANAISGATTASISLAPALGGKQISVKVTGTLAGFATVANNSAKTAKVALAGTPSVSGIPATGSTLTAVTGTWTTGTAFAYKWYADTTAITGATASTFVPTAAEAGKQISVTVIGSLAGYATVAKTSAKTAKILLAGTPTISGTVAAGSTLAAKTGPWATGSVLTYQWYADTTAIAGASSSTLALTSAHLGRQISVKVTGSLSGYTTVAKLSVKTAKVALSATPTIGGVPASGANLAAKPGTWTTGTVFAYQWLADGVAVTGATASTFKPTSAQAGKQISVRVTGSLAGYATVSTTSAKTAKVLITAIPTIGGGAATGATLTAKPGAWTAGTTFAYQWYADSTAITGATASTFAPSSAQAGKQISVRVTGSIAGYPTVAQTSAKTTKVLLVATPTISGNVSVGSALTVVAGTWSPGTALAYQWFRNGTPVSGATAVRYVVRPADAYASLSVRVTGMLAGYTTTARTSASTAPATGKVYALCSALNVDYPDGIRKSGVTVDMKSGVAKPLVGNPYESTALYNLQSPARDADHDGIMCER